MRDRRRMLWRVAAGGLLAALAALGVGTATAVAAPRSEEPAADQDGVAVQWQAGGHGHHWSIGGPPP